MRAWSHSAGRSKSPSQEVCWGASSHSGSPARSGSPKRQRSRQTENGVPTQGDGEKADAQQRGKKEGDSQQEDRKAAANDRPAARGSGRGRVVLLRPKAHAGDDGARAESGGGAAAPERAIPRRERHHHHRRRRRGSGDSSRAGEGGAPAEGGARRPRRHSREGSRHHHRKRRRRREDGDAVRRPAGMGKAAEAVAAAIAEGRRRGRRRLGKPAQGEESAADEGKPRPREEKSATRDPPPVPPLATASPRPGCREAGGGASQIAEALEAGDPDAAAEETEPGESLDGGDWAVQQAVPEPAAPVKKRKRRRIQGGEPIQEGKRVKKEKKLKKEKEKKDEAGTAVNELKQHHRKRRRKEVPEGGTEGKPKGRKVKGVTNAEEDKKPVETLSSTGGAQGDDRYGALIRGVYERRRPGKLADLDALLTKYAGSLAEVYRHVCEKYGEQPEELIDAAGRDPSGKSSQRDSEAMQPSLQTTGTDSSRRFAKKASAPPPAANGVPAKAPLPSPSSPPVQPSAEGQVPPVPKAPATSAQERGRSPRKPEREEHPGWPFVGEPYSPNTPLSSPGSPAAGDEPSTQKAVPAAAPSQLQPPSATTPHAWFPPPPQGPPLAAARPGVAWYPPVGPHAALPWYYAGPPPRAGAFGAPPVGWSAATAAEPAKQRSEAAGSRTPGAWYPPSAAEIPKLLGTSAGSTAAASPPAHVAPDAGRASPAVMPNGACNPTAATASGSSSVPASSGLGAGTAGAEGAAAVLPPAEPPSSAAFSKAAAAARAGKVMAAPAEHSAPAQVVAEPVERSAPAQVMVAPAERGSLTPPEPEHQSPSLPADGQEFEAAPAGKVAGGAAERGILELDSLLGEWRDSMGHRVSVDWSKPSGGRHGQLDVLLTKVRGGGPSIRLNVKQLEKDQFACGHYDLDIEGSNARQMVWRDRRSAGKLSIWER